MALLEKSWTFLKWVWEQMEAVLSSPGSHRAAGSYNPELKAIYFTIDCWCIKCWNCLLRRLSSRWARVILPFSFWVRFSELQLNCRVAATWLTLGGPSLGDSWRLCSDTYLQLSLYAKGMGLYKIPKWVWQSSDWVWILDVWALSCPPCGLAQSSPLEIVRRHHHWSVQKETGK